MRAIIWTGYGSPDVLKLEDIEKPTPKQGEVLVKVHATSAFAGDCELRRFQVAASLWPWLRLYIGVIRPKRIKVLGQEMSGVVEAVGKDVTHFKPGDKVFGTSGMRMGTYAEYVIIPKKTPMVTKPDGIAFEEAAVMSAGGLEALHFLDKAGIMTGKRVLINGAGGSIGTMALQLAKMSGAQVTCVDRSTKLDMLKELGADEVIDHEKEDFWLRAETYDVVLDLVGNIPYLATLRSLKKKGLLVLGNSGLFVPSLLRSWAMMTGKKVRSNLAPGTTNDLERLRDMVLSGKIRVVIDRRFKLEDTAEAHRYIESGSKKGNVVITVVEEGPSSKM